MIVIGVSVEIAGIQVCKGITPPLAKAPKTIMMKAAPSNGVDGTRAWAASPPMSSEPVCVQSRPIPSIRVRSPIPAIISVREEAGTAELPLIPAIRKSRKPCSSQKNNNSTRLPASTAPLVTPSAIR